MTEQQPTDPVREVREIFEPVCEVREIFERKIRQLDNEIKEASREVETRTKQLTRATNERRAIIDAMQKVCNVVAVPPEEQAIANVKNKEAECESVLAKAATYFGYKAGKSAQLVEGVDYELVKGVDYELVKGVDYELVKGVDYELVKVTGNPSESRPASLSELGISNPARQPQKDFVVRFKCGCCVRRSDDRESSVEDCRMENGCYVNADSANLAWDHYRQEYTGCGEIRPPLDPNIVSAKWEQAK